MATLTVGQNAGTLLGPPLIGRAVAGGGWAGGTYPMVIAIIVALIAALLVRTEVKVKQGRPLCRRRSTSRRMKIAKDYFRVRRFGGRLLAILGATCLPVLILV
ncbi:MAG: hypothetical protein ACPL5F_05810 [Moorellaceae bacterium]